MMNYFSPKSAALRYKQGRPPYHHLTIARIKQQLGITNKLLLAVDVACGTGLSTLPLTAIAEKVIGIDVSPEMLALTESHADVEYKLGTAESIQLPNNSVDLITVASGLHWFDIDKFFAEARRILKPDGYIVVYENYYWGGMSQRPEFKQWHDTVYQPTYPAPKRNHFDWNTDKLKTYGFALLETETYVNIMHWNRQQCARYFTTQSNVINAVENGTQTIEEVETWLDKELQSFFGNETKEVLFANWIRYLQRLN